MPSITREAAGLWPGEWLLLFFISVKKDFSALIPIGKSENLEYFGPANPQMILKIKSMPTEYPMDEWRFNNSSSSATRYAATMAITKSQWKNRVGQLQMYVFIVFIVLIGLSFLAIFSVAFI